MMQRKTFAILLFCASFFVLSIAMYLQFSLQLANNNHLQRFVTPSPTPPPTLSPRTYPTSSGKRPQFVVFSFDGSKSIEMWQATREFAAQMNQSGKPLHFTYFISGVYFTPESAAQVYQPPQHKVGESAIGFADSAVEIAQRVKQINAVLADGHEVGSHANGHFDGSRWSENDWNQEFAQFNNLVFGWQSRTPDQTNELLRISAKDVVGFRAPLLAHNDAMYDTLAKYGYRYDASGLSANTLPSNLPKGWPVQEKHGIWMIPLTSVPLAGTRSSILAMDYNFFLTQTRGRDGVRRGTATWQRLYSQMRESYLMQFRSNYVGDRPPLIIGHHFSTWHDGVYWQVMQDVAKEVCGQPEVYCVSFRELVDYLDTQK